MKLPSFVGFKTFAHDAWLHQRGVPFRDDAFTETMWRRHMTWKRYLIEPSISGVVILSLAPIWGWSVFVTLCVGLYVLYAEPAGAPRISGHAAVLITPFSLTTFALSLLMLFKTNSSYGRWWEARTLWGSGYITSRSLLRLSMAYVGRCNPELLPALYRWTAAVLPALASHLRTQQHYLDDHLGSVLDGAELEWLRHRTNPAIAALQVLSSLLSRADLLCPFERQQIEALVSHLDVVVGGCERILRQPMPYAYNRHTQRFILVFITFLPVVFWDYFGWVSLGIMAVMAFLLAGVENIGVQIEEPHRVLPLDGICAATLGALRAMMLDQQGAADVAALAASIQSSPSLRPDAPCAVSLGAAGSGRVAVKPSPPRPSFITVQRSCDGPGQGGSNGWTMDGSSAAVELSGPSSLPTPSTARPTSPDVPDVFAGGLL